MTSIDGPTKLSDGLPPDWGRVLREDMRAEWVASLETFLQEERRHHTIFPAPDDVWTAFHETPFTAVRVVILGQDPYHDDGQAHGLCFSVRPGVRTPPSLRNILLELKSDLGIPPPDHGCLLHWARQGILLLNTVLTVRAHDAHSHRGKGWEFLTDAAVRRLSLRPDPVIFILWGGPAQKKRDLIDESIHTVLTAPHPSPLSAHRGFFGSRPFSAVNALLEQWGTPPIDWRLPPLTPELPLFAP